jgi:hypothetical protein
MEMNFATFKARITAAGDSDRRQEERTSIEVAATMRELGASGVEATVLNVSERGFMAVADGEFEVGARVWLIFAGGRGRANAVVKWIAGGKLGAEFAEPMQLELFRA